MRKRFRNEKGAPWKILGMAALVIVYTTTLWRSNLQQAEAARRDREALEIVKSADELFVAGKYFDAREKYAEVITHASTTNGGASLGTVQRGLWWARSNATRSSVVMTGPWRRSRSCGSSAFTWTWEKRRPGSRRG
jgi:hypothetical protein